MRSWIAGALICWTLSGCGGSGGGGNGSGNIFSSHIPTGANVIMVTVGGTGLCSGTVNIPCAQVTLCQPGTSNCQTIPDILVDSGSTGLRVFSNVISVPLSQTKDNSQNPPNPIGECISFADNTALWGSVQTADVILGGEPAVGVPIQVIDPNFVSSSAGTTACGGAVPYPSPAGLMANGILGVDFFKIDPGPYFSCSAQLLTCVPFTSGPRISTLPSLPVLNPVFSLPVDNNGILLTFPGIPDTGASRVTGSLILGIGTEANNGVGPGVLLYPASASSGSLTTDYGIKTYPQSFIDSGTNGFGLPADLSNPPIPSCADNSFLCPAKSLSLIALNQALNGRQILFQPVSFVIENADKLLILNSPTRYVLNDVAFNVPVNQGFIWGFPFFLGRTVYLGYEGTSSPLGSGPFYAY